MSKIRMSENEWSKNLWTRIKALFSGLDTRVSTLESGASGEANVIDSITFNGTAATPDANKNVALTETDPTVPAWAKAATKPSYTASEVLAYPVYGGRLDGAVQHYTGHNFATAPASDWTLGSHVIVGSDSARKGGLYACHDTSGLYGALLTANSGLTVKGSLGVLYDPTNDAVSYTLSHPKEWRDASGATYNIEITAETWPTLWDQLSTIPTGKIADCRCLNTSDNLMTGGAVKWLTFGQVYRPTDYIFDFCCSQSNQANFYKWRVTYDSTDATHATATPGSVFKFEAMTRANTPYIIEVDGATWPAIWAQLSIISVGGVADCRVFNTTGSLMTNSKVGALTFGQVYRPTATKFDFCCSQSDQPYIYKWRVTFNDAHDDIVSYGNVYRFTGTAI